MRPSRTAPSAGKVGGRAVRFLKRFFGVGGMGKNGRCQPIPVGGWSTGVCALREHAHFRVFSLSAKDGLGGENHILVTSISAFRLARLKACSIRETLTLDNLRRNPG